MLFNSLTRSAALYRVSLYPAVPHFTAFTFTRGTALYRTSVHISFCIA